MDNYLNQTSEWYNYVRNLKIFVLSTQKNAANQNREDSLNEDLDNEESILSNINMFEKEDIALFGSDEFDEYEEEEDYDDNEDVIVNG